MSARITVFLLLFVSILGVAAQTPQIESSSNLANHLDTKRWKSFELDDFTLSLPPGFEHIKRQCIHFTCDIFTFGETHLRLTKGELPYASNEIRAKPEFEETSLTVAGLTSLVFKYHEDPKVAYVATFPSEQLGSALVTLHFRSDDAALPYFARLVLNTIAFKRKLKGPQRFYVQKECPPAAPLEKKPMGFDELKGRLEGSDAKLLTKEIESRRIDFELTTERESEFVKAGVDKQVLVAIRKVALELDEQTKVYERFTANYASQEIAKLKDSLLAGQEFLDRWGCDDLWEEQIKFIRPHVRRIESRIGSLYQY